MQLKAKRSIKKQTDEVKKLRSLLKELEVGGSSPLVSLRSQCVGRKVTTSCDRVPGQRQKDAGRLREHHRGRHRLPAERLRVSAAHHQGSAAGGSGERPVLPKAPAGQTEEDEEEEK